jgi:hypothetical protein
MQLTATRKSVQKVLLTAALALMAAAPAAHAMKFTNQFVEFELPGANWKCGLEGAEWVCQSTDEGKKRDAIIVLAAKLKGDQDTLIKYREYLEKPRKFPGAGGKEVVSQPKYTAEKAVNGTTWVDSMHTDSEIPNFFTRYLATTKEDIAVLVTYSVNKAKFAEYQKAFDDMVSSMKVFRVKGTGLNTGLADANKNLFNSAHTASLPVSVDPGEAAVKTAGGEGGAGKAAGGGIGLIALLALAGGGYFIYKKKKAAGG